MYGFSGYGTNEYGSLRQTSAIKRITAIVAQRTVVLYTNIVRMVIAMTNQIRRVEADENESKTIHIQ